MNDTIAYRETITMWLLTVGGAVLVAIGLYQVFWGTLALGLVLLAAGLALVWYSRATYEISDAQVKATIGYGWPRLVIEGNELLLAERSSPSFLQTGGWGYRGSWLLSKSVIISLGGRGKVMFRTASGKRLTVSTNHTTQLITAAENLIARNRTVS